METPLNGRQRVVRALILTPTRELAAQVQDSVRAYGKHLPLRSTVIFGGVSMVPQMRALRNGVDIVVATPGRLLDTCASVPWTCPRWKCSCWTKPTACWTWASSATFAR